MPETEIDEFVRRRAIARDAWNNGADVKTVAEVLGVRPQRAYVIVRKWKREAKPELFRKAKELLRSGGFSSEEIKLVLAKP